MVSPPVHQILIKLLLFLDKILVELHEIIVDLQHQRLRWKHFCSILDSKMRIVTRWYAFGTTPYKRFTSENMIERCQKIGFGVVLRVVQTKAILFLKSMSERNGSDIERL